MAMAVGKKVYMVQVEAHIMATNSSKRFITTSVLVLGLAGVFFGGLASAFPGTSHVWVARYDATLPASAIEKDFLPTGQTRRQALIVKPGESIQAAIDRARPGTSIYILPGDYRELSHETNALHITKSGMRLIGLPTEKKRVVLRNAGNQRNGIVVVPPERTDCMGCHVTVAPPFTLHPDVTPGIPTAEPVIHGFEIRNIIIEGFRNNGLFTERVDRFRIVNVESIDNPNYGIFPTLSRYGLISHSRVTGADDSGIWVETSTNVQVVHNLVDGNVNGIEISNSDDILLAYNEMRHNTVGVATFLLPDIFADRPGAARITVRDNWIHDNNKPNTARPGSILASVPPGTGILHVGADDSLMTRNRIENNDFFGIVVADYCVVVDGTPFACGVDPATLTPGFLEDSGAVNNRLVGNTLINNGTNPPEHPFVFAAADLALFTLDTNDNCYADNVFATAFSLLGFLPLCE